MYIIEGKSTHSILLLQVQLLNAIEHTTYILLCIGDVLKININFQYLANIPNKLNFKCSSL